MVDEVKVMAPAAVPAVEAPKKKEKMVKVLSSRQGDVVPMDERVLKSGQVAEVSESCAQWLDATFPGLFKRL